jgi:alpha-L-arabinofuranosidase
MMATSWSSAKRREMCVMCSPKQFVAITSCKGCLKDLCRNHFNEHRDKLSTDLHKVFDRHDNILQELQLKIHRESKPSDNNHARAILQQIDQWEKITIKRVSQAANEARQDVERLFDRKAEHDQLKQKVAKMTEALKQQQESESFVETDIDHWMKQLEQLKIDLNRPSTVETNPPLLQIQTIDSNAIINISFPSRTRQNYTS